MEDILEEIKKCIYSNFKNLNVAFNFFTEFEQVENESQIYSVKEINFSQFIRGLNLLIPQFYNPKNNKQLWEIFKGKDLKNGITIQNFSKIFKAADFFGGRSITPLLKSKIENTNYSPIKL